MTSFRPLLLPLVALLLPAGAALAQQPAAAPVPKLPAVLRDARYCELVAVHLTLEGLKASVFNTLGFDDCPADKWDALTRRELFRQFDTLAVVMNGPRHFIMDGIIASGETKTGEVITVGGIVMARRAEIALSLHQAMGPAYTEQTIDRETTYRFDGGKPVFQLNGPDGAVYVMQAYAQIVDPTLSYADLAGLGSRLKSPAGWSYSTRTPDQDLLLTAKGTAIVIQDELKNTYQKVVAN
ncbi:hypothetical protein EV667_0584 [Ancylobacter aquaticus]|uniref:Uncharacterized protein n=1 Tax=Ancylobacter aquaticus TaxID=100 RepID=A0A4R1I573_ANCAQ|nr:hypothetical protein [Ancylobacter aquaticus]TCK30494.1 hypothetical protein EV667_0584 [Ancylobacter aquaticus]